MKVSSDLLEQNSTDREKSLEKRTEPENSELHQTVRIPPDLPIEGRKANWSNFLGQKFLMYGRSKELLLVS
jgi:hypothetical protein